MSFWMICRRPTHPGSRTAPTERYRRLEDARAAAQDLADRTGADFVVLEAAEVIRPRTASAGLFDGGPR